MNFNPDPNKQTQKVLFSRKLHKMTHPKLICFLTMQTFPKQIVKNILEGIKFQINIS